MLKVKRVLISVSDKKGIVAFAQGLHALGVVILSTGGTARNLKEAGIPAREVSDYTGFPEMLDGRVKTLHPKIHGGILALRESKEHMAQIARHGIEPIDMVVVNLYPFESVIKKKNVSLEEAIENIDIGGPAMLRSASKNYKNVAVICNPGKYKEILKELDTNSGLLADSILFHLALEAFEHTANYDRAISGFLRQRLTAKEFSKFPKELALQFRKVQDLRYGENPHQEAAFYKDLGEGSGLAGLKQVGGKELSFNNILDLNAALDLVKDCENPAAVIIKHGNPTGVAEDKTLAQAYNSAWRCDAIAAFGGIVGLNRNVDLPTVEAIIKSGFMECVIAPGFEPKALKVLSRKKNLRLLTIDLARISAGGGAGGFDFKRVYGGLLLQSRDTAVLNKNELKFVTQKKPTAQQLEAMLFGWKIIKSVKSNAILLVKGRRTVGIGCGQTSRVGAVAAAIAKAGKNARNSVLVSDAFIPKTDNVRLAAKAGIKAIIQTGGSISDEDVIKAADKAKIAMVTTGIRHFRH
ncbi:MAG: bifunctional phosphoribosylaminoimidazolecarboxamide formyltransferase/IMP cyclohydrolase [Candidatus Omnitrophica bacterium]|nr:bifunctional phosphoribosylaminoimidazolecarboxamide formyltransferase/IMP cyclohydrolase [Candidatus Omnitrophota bacterium]